MSIIQAFAITCLTVYILGALYYLTEYVSFAFNRERDREVTQLVSFLSHMVVFIDVVFFWPLNLVRR